MPDVITGLELGRERLNGAALCMSSPICSQRRGKNENEDGQKCELPFHQDCVFRNMRRVLTRKWRCTSSLSLAGLPEAATDRSGTRNSEIGEKSLANSKSAIPSPYQDWTSTTLLGGALPVNRTLV